ncbi:MAG: Phosphoserine phosphatase [Candidatus Heimdallarchaeota archaeon LC_3]|nr:MAG: Phosphoserine phosphatase [Candidatus Heimdallarchaeota archaeon LC_3]
MALLSKSTYLLVFDLDGTLTTYHSSWQFVLEKTNNWEPNGRINLEKFLKNELKGNNKEKKYLEFCRLDANLLKGLEYNKFLNILNEIHFQDNIQEFVENLRKLINFKSVVISSGFSELAIKAKKLFSFDQAVANELGKENGFLNGTMKISVSWMGKRDMLRNFKKKYNIGTEQVISFGDTTADIELFKESGLNFACFNANKDLIEVADHHVTNFLEVPNLIKDYIKKKSG